MSSPDPSRVTTRDFDDHDKCPHWVYLNFQAAIVAYSEETIGNRNIVKLPRGKENGVAINGFDCQKKVRLDSLPTSVLATTESHESGDRQTPDSMSRPSTPEWTERITAWYTVEQ
jgi:hypothetical protein